MLEAALKGDLDGLDLDDLAEEPPDPQETLQESVKLAVERTVPNTPALRDLDEHPEMLHSSADARAQIDLSANLQAFMDAEQEINSDDEAKEVLGLISAPSDDGTDRTQDSNDIDELLDALSMHSSTSSSGLSHSQG